MTQFSGKTVGSIHDLTIDNNTAAYTCAKCYHDKILYTPGRSVSHLTDCCCICIVGTLYLESEAFM